MTARSSGSFGDSSEPDSGQAGIEANDLASLLCRFEEATSSVDDLNILAFTKRRDLLHKTKSAGNSPVVTPRASPLPHQGNRIIRADANPTQQHSILTPQVRSGSQSLLPKKSTAQSISVCLSGPVTNSNSTVLLRMQPTTTTSQAQKGNKSFSAFLHTRGNVVASTGLKFCATEAPKLSPTTPIFKSSQFQPRPGTVQTLDVKLCPVGTTSPASQTKENCLLTITGSSSSPRPTITVSKQSLLHSVLNPVFQQQNTSRTSGRRSKTSFIPESKEVENASSFQKAQSRSQGGGLAAEDEEIKTVLDHSYCTSGKEQVDASTSSTARNISSDKEISELQRISPNIEESAYSRGQLTVGCSSYSWREDSQSVSSGSNLLHGGGGSSNSLSSSNVLEEREVPIDAEGNDSFPEDICQKPSSTSTSTNSKSPSQSVPSSLEKNSNFSRKRSYRNRQRAEFSSSPIREDTGGDFFDKIPSYYTALSIPTKPMKTTAFATVTKSLGSTDHLEYLVAGDPMDEGHYDKVPAHRRCFTNTTKDIALDLEDSTADEITKENIHPSVQFHDLPSSSKSEQTDADDIRSEARLRKRSSSPCPSSSHRRSRSSSRRSRSSSRRSCRSDSSMSHCSTCSYRSSSACSTCSFSSQSRSRSRSRSPSDIEERWPRHRHRSRSHSPAYTRDRRLGSQRDRSGQRFRSRSPLRHDGGSHESRSSYHRSRHHSGMDRQGMERRKAREEERLKAMEERRVVYVGKIPNGYTKRQLYQRFEGFGEIKEVKVNFREHGDNYGFVTFAYACDAIAAKEKGNNVSHGPKFDLCFGGRRQFCPDQYADLDGNREVEEEYAPLPKNLTEELDYAALLKQHSSRQKKTMFY